jgi:hypothetical protein
MNQMSIFKHGCFINNFIEWRLGNGKVISDGVEEFWGRFTL